MVTLDELLEIACKADEVIGKRVPGISLPDDQRNVYYDREYAMAAARWLEEEGLKEIEQIGPFGQIEVKRGDTVRIKQGTIISTTHPRYDYRNNPKMARRTYKVKVHGVHPGYIQTHWHSHERRQAVRDQQVCWVGEGGYWCYACTKDIEVVA